VTSDKVAIFSLFGIGVALTLLVGVYGIVVTRNLVRTLIAMEVLTKAATVLIIVCGYVGERMALAQALAVTLIIIEVAVIVAAVGIVLSIHRKTGTIDRSSIRNLKG
jgi:multisubunit Na+/H+ antiporter MnhC subunit